MSSHAELNSATSALPQEMRPKFSSYLAKIFKVLFLLTIGTIVSPKEKY